MSAGRTLVVGVHHPPDADVEALAKRLEGAGRPVEILRAPYKENLRMRQARRGGRLPAALTGDAPEPSASVRAAWKRCEALLVLDLPAERLDEIPELRFVQAYSAGVEHLGAAALAARGVTLASAAGVAAVPIAEFVIARLLEVWKGTRQLEAMQRARALRRPDSRVIAGATLGIVGLGAIGRALALRAAALGMRVIATRRHPERGGAPGVADVYGPDGLHTLLAASDAVVLAAPGSAATRDLIDARALAGMRPGAVLCNVARGELLDEAALVDALSRGQLRAAILDVTRREPLPADDPLWDAPNLHLSPHCAAAPDAYDERLLALFVDNLRRHAAGEPVRNAVAP